MVVVQSCAWILVKSNTFSRRFRHGRATCFALFCGNSLYVCSTSHAVIAPDVTAAKKNRPVGGEHILYLMLLDFAFSAGLLAKRLAGSIVSKMTYFESSATFSINLINQSLFDARRRVRLKSPSEDLSKRRRTRIATPAVRVRTSLLLYSTATLQQGKEGNDSAMK